MSGTIRLTAAQAMMRWLSVQTTEDGERFIEGVWAIFGHGNVAGIGEALHGLGDALPTWRGQNEQTMAHAAIAYAKTKRRRRAHAVTSSIGPGSTNLVTAAALAHVNRLPILFICGDVFANRRPDPVLQQIEDFDDGTVSANDCFKPVTRYFDRISRPEHILTALPRALRTLTDPADCGPVCLAFCQDVQAEAFDYPTSFFETRVLRIRRPEPDPVEVAEVVAAIEAAQAPVIVSGGGVLYSGAEDLLADFAARRNIPIVETQAGKGATASEHPMNFGSPGVTGSACGNEACAAADLVIGIGTRFQDFTTGSWTVFANPARKLISINVHGYDALKHGALGVVGDARVTLEKIDAALGDLAFTAADPGARADWHAAVKRATAAPAKDANTLPSDAQVIGAVQRIATENTVAMCAAGTMPGALQVLWQSAKGGYHMEYGYSCMGYEVAGALGIKLADPSKEVICFVGDGSYMMANSELATAVMRRVPFTVVLTDNRGYGCINRLQQECGGAEFNNMYKDSNVEVQPEIDFVAHAASMGAHAEKAADIADLEARIAAARGRDIPSVIVIDTEAASGTGAGGHWWDVAVPEVGGPERLEKARQRYHANTALQRVFNWKVEAMILYGTNPIAWSNDDDWSLGDHLSLEDCLGDCRKIGFDGIEKGHKMPDEGAALKAKLGEYGLRFAAGWHSTNLLVNDIETEKKALQAWIDFTRAAGGDHINACECSNTVHGNDKVPVNDRPIMTDAEWDRFSTGYEELSRFAAEQGVKMGYHHHMGTIIESAADIDRFMAMAGPHTRLLLDTGHCTFGGADPAEVARKYMDRVTHIHAKNVRPEIMKEVRYQNLSFLEGVRRGAFTVPGDPEGCVAFEPVLKIAAGHGYSGWLVIEAEQDSAVREPFHYQNMGLKALKAMARGVGLDTSDAPQETA